MESVRGENMSVFARSTLFVEGTVTKTEIRHAKRAMAKQYTSDDGELVLIAVGHFLRNHVEGSEKPVAVARLTKRLREKLRQTRDKFSKDAVEAFLASETGEAWATSLLQPPAVHSTIEIPQHGVDGLAVAANSPLREVFVQELGQSIERSDSTAEEVQPLLPRTAERLVGSEICLNCGVPISAHSPSPIGFSSRGPGLGPGTERIVAQGPGRGFRMDVGGWLTLIVGGGVPFAIFLLSLPGLTWALGTE